MRQPTKKAVKATVVSTAALMSLAAGSALGYNASHENIVLKNPAGDLVQLDASGKGPAYSVKTTCFGTVGCHGDATAVGNATYSYDEIERHSYHAMNGTNELRGFNNWNPDGITPDGNADAFRRGVSPQGKNWVQGPGHLGNW
ncbi:cytochrome C [Geomonas nitrogeniifigens]|uniref:Cytochrome C n=1 Tax=Geomonas diazotrophica TaxID=2843197 RepID=A0ABX8JIF5_9BACT|nr:cytochrome C [Geomonas nitrogeniifigens]QWV96414.1 cytochrome C [Geomonas nitrogeniifigens]